MKNVWKITKARMFKEWRKERKRKRSNSEPISIKQSRFEPYDTRKWVDEETKTTWRYRYLITFNKNYGYPDLDNNLCPWITFRLKCDFCFMDGHACMDEISSDIWYQSVTRHPRSKRHRWKYTSVEGVMINPNDLICLKMVVCYKCKLFLDFDMIITERENRLQICYLDVEFKFN